MTEVVFGLRRVGEWKCIHVIEMAMTAHPKYQIWKCRKLCNKICSASIARRRQPTHETTCRTNSNWHMCRDNHKYVLHLQYGIAGQNFRHGIAHCCRTQPKMIICTNRNHVICAHLIKSHSTQQLWQLKMTLNWR